MRPSVALVVLTGGAGAAERDRLLDSIDRYNVDRLPVLVDPEGRDPDAPILSLWSCRAADAYVWIDPRVEVIRRFGRDDFVTPSGDLFTVATEAAETHVDGDAGRADETRVRIWSEVGVTDTRRLEPGGLAVLSSEVLDSFHRDFLVPRGWGYADAVRHSADERAWYLAWVLASTVIPCELREPLVVDLRSPDRAQSAVARGLRRDDLARGFLGVLWPDGGEAILEAGRPQLLADRLTSAQLSSALLRRSTRKAPRLQRMLRLD